MYLTLTDLLSFTAVLTGLATFIVLLVDKRK